MDQRHHPRFHGQGSVICSHFNREGFHEGQVLNFSPDGMCIRTDRFFKPGANVLIRLHRCPASQAARQEEGGMRTTTLARIQWCRQDGAVPEEGYTSGVRYL